MVPAVNPLERRTIETGRDYSPNGLSQPNPANAWHSHFPATKEYPSHEGGENVVDGRIPVVHADGADAVNRSFATRRYVEGSARRMASATNATLAPAGPGTVRT